MDFQTFLWMLLCSIAVGFGISSFFGIIGYVVKSTLGIINIK